MYFHVKFREMKISKFREFFFSGGYDSSFDKTDRKISAHATLQTPPTRTSFPGDDNKKFVPKAIPGKPKKKFCPKNLKNLTQNF